MSAAVEPGNVQKTCFVVMGFGKKTDFQSQRTLDLDKTYRTIIKPAVLAAGLKCVRADDVVHSGSIDKVMYDLLLNSDAVIADLSTCNPNAIYELGVRHALRPHTTIIIAESQFKNPFDLNHILFDSYKHLGEWIDAEEAAEVQARLTAKLRQLLDATRTDSPVYTYLNDLNPPALRAATAVVAEAVAAVDLAEKALAKMSAPAEAVEAASELTSSILLDAAVKARAGGDWVTAKALFAKLREQHPNDHYLTQQLALATYKSRIPSVQASLDEACKILRELSPDSCTDPETLGLWGAIHKRLWEEKKDPEFLDESLAAYERGFYLRNDAYTGINYAFLLNMRAGITAATRRGEAIADYFMARRVRQRLIDAARVAADQNEQKNPDLVERFWAQATLVEAHAGVGDEAGAEAMMTELATTAPEPWMMDSLRDQLGKLKEMLRTQASLAQV